MFLRNFHPARFLRTVCGTDPFREYCAQRDIDFESTPDAQLSDESQRWSSALARLPSDRQMHVALELAQVNELGDRDAIGHLFKAAEGGELPPDLLPGDAAVALWFLMHHPDIFHEVFLHHESEEQDAWRNAQAPAGLELNYLDAKSASLSTTLQEFFQMREGVGRYCAVDASRLREAYCFIVHVSDRVHLADGFSAAGEPTAMRLWPAFPVIFAYYPQDGMILLRSHVQAADWILELFQRFGRNVLGTELGPDCLRHTFELDLLKGRFDPLPDADDMELVRVKTLHLHYPERDGRRQLRLETLASDGQFAILELMREHVSGSGIFDQLRVGYAELQLRLRVEGGSKNYIVRLWPNRSNLGQTPLADRFRACLKRWGIYHVG
jgi:hypothetical protein